MLKYPNLAHNSIVLEKRATAKYGYGEKMYKYITRLQKQAKNKGKGMGNVPRIVGRSRKIFEYSVRKC